MFSCLLSTQNQETYSRSSFISLHSYLHIICSNQFIQYCTNKADGIVVMLLVALSKGKEDRKNTESCLVVFESVFNKFCRFVFYCVLLRDGTCDLYRKSTYVNGTYQTFGNSLFHLCVVCVSYYRASKYSCDDALSYNFLTFLLFIIHNFSRLTKGVSDCGKC